MENTTDSKDSDPPSPCRDVCLVPPGSDYCAGCWRSLDEIAAWPSASAAEKRAILARLATRKADARRKP